MMCLQNKMVKPFGAEMCYKTFWAPILLDLYIFSLFMYLCKGNSLACSVCRSLGQGPESLYCISDVAILT